MALKLGAHQSVSKGYITMGKEALSIGATTLQFFSRNPRGAKAKQVTAEELQSFNAFIVENQLSPMVIHAPYTMNACSIDPRIRELAEEMFTEDLKRLQQLPGNFYNFHPGSHLKQGVDTAIKLIADLMNKAMLPDLKTKILLETMSGKGSEVGSSFQELKAIIDGVHEAENIGVCMDACHLWDAGYDIVNDLEGVLEEFDRIIGIDRLYAFHINDSMNPLGSRKDRHAMLGDGHIGRAAIVRIITHPSLRHIPFILETPTELDGHAEEIRFLREATNN